MGETTEQEAYSTGTDFPKEDNSHTSVVVIDGAASHTVTVFCLRNPTENFGAGNILLFGPL